MRNIKIYNFTTEDFQIDVWDTNTIQPRQSLRTIAAAVGTYKSTVHDILKQNKSHTFKIHLVPELNEDDQ